MLFDYKNLKGALAIAVILTSPFVLADKIHDPTQPKFVVKEVESSTDSSTPMTAISQQSFPSGDVRLQGILNKKGRTVAIISGKLYAVGDQISGYKINKINQDNVVLIGSGTQKRLYVYE